MTSGVMGPPQNFHFGVTTPEKGLVNRGFGGKREKKMELKHGIKIRGKTCISAVFGAPRFDETVRSDVVELHVVGVAPVDRAERKRCRKSHKKKLGKNPVTLMVIGLEINGAGSRSSPTKLNLVKVDQN